MKHAVSPNNPYLTQFDPPIRNNGADPLLLRDVNEQLGLETKDIPDDQVVRVATKDLVEVENGVAGESYTAGGVPLLERVNATAAQHGIYTQLLLDAGCELVGTTKSAQLGTATHTKGVDNALDPRLSPGGSSGGSAAAVAEGSVHIATASDGGGSIRVPGALNGLYAHKPSRGLTPTGEDDVHGLATAGFLADNPRLTGYAYNLSQNEGQRGYDHGYPRPDGPYDFLSDLDSDERSRIVVVGSLGNELLDPRSDHAIEVASEVLRSLGHNVERIPVTEQPFGRENTALREAYAIVHTVAIFEELTGLALAHTGVGNIKPGKDVDKFNYAMYRFGRAYQDRLDSALEVVTSVSATFDAFLDNNNADMVMSPTLTNPTPTERDMRLLPPVVVSAFATAARLGILDLSRKSAGFERFTLRQAAGGVPDSAYANITGHPASSLPVVWNERGAPVSIQLTGRKFEDAKLIGMADRMQQGNPLLWSKLRKQRLADRH